jgi:hypothetical protein
MKSGTSTLRDYLGDINSIYVAPGEPHFFSNDAKYALGLDWYAQLFENTDDKAVVGEKTATYSYAPGAPERIHQCLPNAKLIWLFRNPVSRTYSHYWHSVCNGSEPLSFESAIAQEDRRVVHDIWRGYTKRSRYIEQVQRFLQYFSKDQMLFLIFEEMLQDPPGAVGKVLRFLELEHVPTGSIPNRRSHATIIPRSRRLQWLAKMAFGSRTRPFNLAKRLNRRKQPGYPPMSDQMRRHLEQLFAEDNEKLASVTGVNVDLWQPRTPVGK